MEPAAEGGVDDWGEVVTRYPYRKVRMDHLLSTESRHARAFTVQFSRDECLGAFIMSAWLQASGPIAQLVRAHA